MDQHYHYIHTSYNYAKTLFLAWYFTCTLIQHTLPRTNKQNNSKAPYSRDTPKARAPGPSTSSLQTPSSSRTLFPSRHTLCPKPLNVVRAHVVAGDEAFQSGQRVSRDLVQFSRVVDAIVVALLGGTDEGYLEKGRVSTLYCKV